MRFFPRTLDRAAERRDGRSDPSRLARGRGSGCGPPRCRDVTPFIGFIGLSRSAFEAHFTPGRRGRLAAGPAVLGTRLRPEGAQAALDFAFDVARPGRDRLDDHPRPTSPSQRVMQQARHDPRSRRRLRPPAAPGLGSTAATCSTGCAARPVGRHIRRTAPGTGRRAWASAAYRSVLAMRDVRRVLLLSLVIRVPMWAANVVLDPARRVTHLHRSLRARPASLVGVADRRRSRSAHPWRGRRLDRVGLRAAVAPSLVVLARVLDASRRSCRYWPLLVLADGRRAVRRPVVLDRAPGAHARRARRAPARTALAVDSVVIEISFMIGPALGVAARDLPAARRGRCSAASSRSVAGRRRAAGW